MQRFRFEHRFSLPPAQLVHLLDDMDFREYLVRGLVNIHASERICFETSEHERFKTIRVYPKVNLPSWLQRALKDRESHFDMTYRLDKKRMVEKIEGSSRLGMVTGEIVYLANGNRGTIRRFTGEFNCRIGIVGPAVEKFYLVRMTMMQNQEAELTEQYIVGQHKDPITATGRT